MDAADATSSSPASTARPGGPTALPRGLRSARWRGRGDTVVLLARHAGRPPSRDELTAAAAALHAEGAAQVISGALHANELGPWIEAGFVAHERLHLLEHDLHGLPRVPSVPVRIRRGRRTDHDRALVVDRRCFDPFWRLDEPGLDDALRATAAARLRVAVDPDVVGYAVTGRSGDRGYLQRLAVSPSHQGRGIGRALVLDGLHWLARRRARSAVVNTQIGNDGALRLYRELGFRLLPDGLTVVAHTARPDAGQEAWA